MKKILMLLFVGLIIFVSSGIAEEIKVLNLDDANSIATLIKTDMDVKSEGNGSVKITTLWPTVISLGEIDLNGVDKTKLMYQVQVKSENLEGNAYLEMWCFVNGGQYVSRGMNSTIDGTTDWKAIETPFFLKAGEKADKVILNIVINGKGSVWVDHAVLNKEPLE